MIEEILRYVINIRPYVRDGKEYRTAEGKQVCIANTFIGFTEITVDPEDYVSIGMHSVRGRGICELYAEKHKEETPLNEGSD